MSRQFPTNKTCPAAMPFRLGMLGSIVGVIFMTLSWIVGYTTRPREEG